LWRKIVSSKARKKKNSPVCIRYSTFFLEKKEYPRKLKHALFCSFSLTGRTDGE
jgi:hypothetical protein